MGAAGIILYTPGQDSLQTMFFKGFHSFMGAPRVMLDSEDKFQPMINMQFVAYAHQNYIKEVLKTSKQDISKLHKLMKEGHKVSRKLKGKINYSYQSSFESPDCKNIAGVLRGTDPKLKDEYIVVSTYLDLLVVGQAIQGDSLYNGMWDNATGSAATISIAEVIKNENIKPKKSIIFINYTAEEVGLVGSEYFAISDLLKD